MADLYGKVNRDVIPMTYEGVTTETAEVVVDNKKRTIKVNVIGDMGEGAVKYDEVQDLTEQQKEIARANIGATDTVYEAGDNITIEGNVISAQDTTYNNLPAKEGGTDNSLVTDGDKYNWDNKSNFSGDYNDLDNKPTIPAAQVNSDWDADSGVAQILHKPSINDGTLTITQNGATKGTFGANSSESKTIDVTDTTYQSKSASQGGTDVSLVTTGEKYNWNNKQDTMSAGNGITITNNTIVSVITATNIEITES